MNKSESKALTLKNMFDLIKYTLAMLLKKKKIMKSMFSNRKLNLNRPNRNYKDRTESTLFKFNFDQNYQIKN